MDLVADALFDDRKLRMLSVVDALECRAIGLMIDFARVSECPLVPVLGRCNDQDRRLANQVQREPTLLRARLTNTRRVRPSQQAPARYDETRRSENFYFYF